MRLMAYTKLYTGIPFPIRSTATAERSRIKETIIKWDHTIFTSASGVSITQFLPNSILFGWFVAAPFLCFQLFFFRQCFFRLHVFLFQCSLRVLSSYAETHEKNTKIVWAWFRFVLADRYPTELKWIPFYEICCAFLLHALAKFFFQVNISFSEAAVVNIVCAKLFGVK